LFSKTIGAIALVLAISFCINTSVKAQTRLMIRALVGQVMAEVPLVFVTAKKAAKT